MSFYIKYPLSGGGVPTYANLAAFPSAVASGNGALGIALDSNILYESNGTSWIEIAGPGAILSVGTIDSQAKSANGAVIASDALIMQTADATHPGLISTGTQAIAGKKEFSTQLNADGGIGLTAAGTLLVGTDSNTTSIDLGGASVTQTAIAMTTPQAMLHYGYTTGNSNVTSGTVGTGAMVLGRVHPTNNIGQGAVIIGGEASVVTGTGYNSIAIGPGCRTEASYAQAIGNGNVAQGASSFAAGNSNQTTTNGDSGTGLGRNVMATGQTAQAIGEGVTAQGYAQMAVGEYNVAAGTPASRVSTDDVFIVGNGASSGARSNAFQVRRDGVLTIPAATASTVPYINSSSQLAYSAVTPTELGYVSGVTSSIQTQLDSKQATGNYITALTGDVTAAGPGSSAATLATVNTNVGTFASSTVNGKGLVTAAGNLTGDATTSGAALTLATVNANVGSFGSATASGTFTVNAKGLVTAASSTAIQITESQVTNLTTDLAAKLTTTLASTNIFVGNGSNVATAAAMSGDATLSNSGGLTLATVNANVGSFTNANITVNAKGLITAAANGTGGATAYSFRVYDSTTSLTQNNYVTISWTTVDFDTASGFSATTYTIPATGKWQFNASVDIAASFSGEPQTIVILKNGTAVSGGLINGAGARCMVKVMDVINCTLSDTITVQVRSNSSSPSIGEISGISHISNYFSGFFTGT